MPEVIPGNRKQGALFVAIDGSFGRLHIVRGSSLDFDEAQHIFVPADKIDLAARMGRAEVAGDEDISAAAEVEVSVFFATAAGALVFRNFLRRKCVGAKPVEGTNGSVRNTARKHWELSIERNGRAKSRM